MVNHFSCCKFQIKLGLMISCDFNPTTLKKSKNVPVNFYSTNLIFDKLTYNQKFEATIVALFWISATSFSFLFFLLLVFSNNCRKKFVCLRQLIRLGSEKAPFCSNSKISTPRVLFTLSKEM